MQKKATDPTAIVLTPMELALESADFVVCSPFLPFAFIRPDFLPTFRRLKR